MSNEFVIGAVFFVLGLIPAYYFYVKSIRIKEPIWSIKSNNLISGSVSTLENLKITHNKFKIENLTISKILFLNLGSETIDRQDIQTINPPRISVSDCKILDVSMVGISNPSNNFRAVVDESKENALIDFDYIDLNQGLVIQVVHTGLSSDEIKFEGDIKGVQSIKQIDPKLFQNETQSRKNLRDFILAGVTAFTFLGIGLYSPEFYNSWKSYNAFIGLIVLLFGIVGVLSTIVFAGGLLGYTISIFVKSYRLPTKLGMFLE